MDEQGGDSNEVTLAGPPLAVSSTDQTLLADERQQTQPSAAPGRITQLLREGGRPSELGHYVLLGQLGEGGMGVVFAAYDKRLDRKVAIKLLRATGGDAQHRLIREAQAMARLSHPNVVQIYEIGELDELAAPHPDARSRAGEVFMVMEFIDGLTLGSWLRQRKRTRDEILAVFTAAGRGLAAAHGKGLVHRDFKPENVMIRADGRVVVMDFGLARERSEGGAIGAGALADALAAHGNSGLSIDLTATGAMLGTPAYMSPEQFRGEPSDAKSDQFSFCVALWEALHGVRPFRGESLAELTYAVLHDRRAPASSEVPGWLQHTISRGLASTPAARWPNMDALLAALAADPTRKRRLWFAGLAAAAALAGTLLGAHLLEARDEARTRETCRAEARAIEQAWSDELGQQFAQRFEDPAFAEAWGHVRTWMNDYAQQWATLRERSCIAHRIDETRSATEYERAAACLDEGRLAVEALVETWGSAEDRVVAYAATAAAELPPLGLCENESWLAQRIQPPDDPALRERVIALRAELERAEALGLIGEFKPALARAKQVQADAEVLGWTPLLAEATLIVGNLQNELREVDSARASLERASLLAIASADELVALRASIHLTSLVGYQQSEHETGRYWAAMAEALLTRVGLVGTVHEAALRSSIGDLQWSTSDYPSAMASYQAALELYRSALGPNHPQVAQQLLNVGYLHMEQGNYDRALELFAEARVLAEAALGPNHAMVAESLNYTGNAHSYRGEPELAIATHERALAVMERSLGPESPGLAESLNNLGVAYSHTKQLDRAQAMYERSLTLLEKALGSRNPTLATAINNIATVQAARGNYEEALVNFRRALELDLATRGAEHKHVGIARNNIASMLDLLGQHEQAITEYQLALAIFESKLGPTHPHVGRVLLGLGRAQLSIGRLAEARASFERAEPLIPSEGIDRASLTFELARLLDREGRRAEALARAEQARANAQALGEVGRDLLGRVQAWLAERGRGP